MSPKQQLEGEVFAPIPDVVAQARVKDWEQIARRAQDDLEGFWAAEAEELEWYRKWDKVLDDSNKPFFTPIAFRTFANFETSRLSAKYE